MASFRWKTAQHFEKKWWSNYLSRKDPVEYQAWKRIYWLRFLDEISDWMCPQPDQTFLDMGCGPAGIFMVLPGKVEAVDPLLENYKTNLPCFRPGDFKNVTFTTARVEEYQSAAAVDTVFSLNVINHVENIGSALQTLNNCCKPNGHLVLSIDVHNHKFLRSLFSYLQFDILHPYQFTLVEYKKLLKDEGFIIIGEKCLKQKAIFSYVVLVAKKICVTESDNH